MLSCRLPGSVPPQTLGFPKPALRDSGFTPGTRRLRGARLGEPPPPLSLQSGNPRPPPLSLQEGSPRPSRPPVGGNPRPSRGSAHPSAAQPGSRRGADSRRRACGPGRGDAGRGGCGHRRAAGVRIAPPTAAGEAGAAAPGRRRRQRRRRQRQRRQRQRRGSRRAAPESERASEQQREPPTGRGQVNDPPAAAGTWASEVGAAGATSETACARESLVTDPGAGTPAAAGRRVGAEAGSRVARR